MNRQVEIKVMQIARMVVKGMKLTQIAIEMGMSYTGLVQITRRPEYLMVEERVRNEVVGKMDARLAQRAAMEVEVEDAVPEALQVLLDGVRKKRDLKAALEVLDRDPRRQFAKTRPANAVDPNTNPASAIPSEALAAAVKDADTTHNILMKAASAAKPAEA